MHVCRGCPILKPFGASYARAYDLLNSDKDYSAESDFVLELAALTCGRSRSLEILDLGCGTGRHLEALASAASELVGVEISPDMAEIARGRVPEATIVVGGAQAVDLGRQFDLVVSLFDVLSYQASNTEVRGFLGAVRRHLKPAGAAVVDFWHLPGLVIHPPSNRSKTIETGAEKIKRNSTSSIDWTTGTVRVAMETQTYIDGHLESQTLEDHTMRAFLVQELELLAEIEGLRVVRSGGWMTAGVPTSNDWHAYVCLKHANA